MASTSLCPPLWESLWTACGAAPNTLWTRGALLGTRAGDSNRGGRAKPRPSSQDGHPLAVDEENSAPRSEKPSVTWRHDERFLGGRRSCGAPAETVTGRRYVVDVRAPGPHSAAT